MDEILKDLNWSRQHNNIFAYWEEERRLRQKIRNVHSSQNVKLHSLEDYLFIKRAFYFTDRSLFFSILFANLNNMFLLDLLLQSPATFLIDFFQFLPAYIQKSRPDNQQLKFLIPLYQDQWQEHFTEICNQLDARQCRFLLERTASPGLLRILQKRLDSIQALTGSSSLKGSSSNDEALYGDKKALVKQALYILSQVRTAPTEDKYIELGELLFKIGLIEDCLLWVKNKLSKYRQSESEPRQPEKLKNFNGFIQQANRLLPKALPLYALLYHPEDSYNYARDMHQSLFPEFTPDGASLLYLDLYNNAAADPKSLSNYSFFELVTRIRKIKHLRPGDELVFLLEQFIKLKSTSTLMKMFTISRQRIFSRPHEGFIIMEIIRFMMLDMDLIIPDKLTNDLLSSYGQLFNWIPSPLFMNQAIADQLSLRDKKVRNRIEPILNRQKNSSYQKPLKPETENFTAYNWPGQEVPREYLLGKLLGVL